MELIAVVFLLFFAWAVLKILGMIFYTGAFIITLPFKIIGLILLVTLVIPLTIFSIAVSLIGIIIPLIPFVLLAWAVVHILRDRRTKN